MIQDAVILLLSVTVMFGTVIEQSSVTGLYIRVAKCNRTTVYFITAMSNRTR